MKQDVNFLDFYDAFNKSDNYRKNFSYEGLSALFTYLEETEEEDYELDVIALCCEFTEYDSIGEYISDYGKEIDDDMIIATIEGTERIIIQQH